MPPRVWSTVISADRWVPQSVMVLRLLARATSGHWITCAQWWAAGAREGAGPSESHGLPVVGSAATSDEGFSSRGGSNGCEVRRFSWSVGMGVESFFLFNLFIIIFLRLSGTEGESSRINWWGASPYLRTQQ